jgi:mannose-6-phosphate isomerase
MTATRLIPRRIDKVWGRHRLSPWFPDAPTEAEPVGEIWFEMPDGSVPELLVKYLFTSEKLSVQVHPDDAAAQAAGYLRGKDEAWVVLDAEPDATLGLGLTHVVSRAELRAAALDGSIEALVDWKPAHVGDVVYSRAGTVHAIGPGLAIVEVQQNVDLTYRLYDYGRPRELHLDAGIAVSHPEPWADEREPRDLGHGRTLLAEGPAFTLERWSVSGPGVIEHPVPCWLIPLGSGEVWYLEGSTNWDFGTGGDVLIAYALPTAIPGLWQSA